MRLGGSSVGETTKAGQDVSARCNESTKKLLDSLCYCYFKYKTFRRLHACGPQ